MTDVVLASFDTVPSPKGASAHILANARILGERHRVSLVTLGSAPIADHRHRPIHLAEPNWLRRGLMFEQRVADVFREYDFDVYHVRSPWEGLAVPPGRRIVYEVNAFYSIEVGYHYPATAGRAQLRQRLRARELCLLDRADMIVTPSETTAQYIRDLGFERARIRVVPNAPSVRACEHAHVRRGDDARDPVRLCYVGTVAPWQGLPEILAVLSRIERAFEVTVVATGSRRRLRWMRKLVDKRGLSERVRFVEPMDTRRLGALLAAHDIGLAPLLPTERNLVQGCNPIKVMDYAAAHLAVLAPDMPVVREILGPEYPLYARWKRSAAVELLDWLIRDPDARARLAAAGAARVRDELSADHQRRRLLNAYDEVLA